MKLPLSPGRIFVIAGIIAVLVYAGRSVPVRYQAQLGAGFCCLHDGTNLCVAMDDLACAAQNGEFTDVGQAFCNIAVCGQKAPNTPVCGNGTVDAGEQCDGAGQAQCAAGRTCDACVCKMNFVCPPACSAADTAWCQSQGMGCMATANLPCYQCQGSCGNKVLDAGEACDDGNTINGDCCSSTCALENCGCNATGSSSSTSSCPALATLGVCQGGCSKTPALTFVNDPQCMWGGCGDGQCNAYYGEKQTCPQDCKATSGCGDGICGVGEIFMTDLLTPQVCFEDCGVAPFNNTGGGACSVCGDGMCAPNETACSCPRDCAPKP